MNLKRRLFFFLKVENLVFCKLKNCIASGAPLFTDRFINSLPLMKKDVELWKRKKESSSSKLKELEQKVKQLEQIADKKQIMIDYLEKLIDVAKDEL